MANQKLHLFIVIGIGLSVCPTYAQVPSKDTGTCDYRDANGKYIGNGPCRGSSSGGSGSEPRYSITAPFKKLFGSRRSSPGAPPSPADIAFDQGAAAEKLEHWEEAERAFHKALELESSPRDQVFIYEHLARTYWVRGRTEDAISAIRSALQIEPGNEWSREQLAHLLTNRLAAKKKAGDTNGAEDDFREALSLAPDDPDVKSWSGWIDDIKETRRAKEMRDRLLQSLGSNSTNSATGGLTLMDADSRPAEPGKAQAGSTGGLQPLGLDAFKPGNPTPEEIRAGVDLQTGPARAAAGSVPSKAGDEAMSAATLNAKAGSKEQAVNAGRDIFDTSGKYAGSLTEVNVGGMSPSNPDHDPVVSDEVRKQKPKIVEMEQKRNELKKQRKAVREQVAKIEQELNTVKDPKAHGELLVKRAEAIQSDTNLTNQIFDINFHIDEEIPKPSPPPTSKGSNTNAKPNPEKK